MVFGIEEDHVVRACVDNVIPPLGGGHAQEDKWIWRFGAGLSMSQVNLNRFCAVVAERVYTDVLREHYMECHGIPGAIRILCFGSDCDFERVAMAEKGWAIKIRCVPGTRDRLWACSILKKT